jgi:hypothetical protein
VRVNRARPRRRWGDCRPDGTRQRGVNPVEIEPGVSGCPFRGARMSSRSGRRTRRHCGSVGWPHWRGADRESARIHPPPSTPPRDRGHRRGRAHTPGVHPLAVSSTQDGEQEVPELAALLGRGAGSPSRGGHRLGMPWYVRGDGHGSLRGVHSRSFSRAMKCAAARPRGGSMVPRLAAAVRAVAEHHFLGSPMPDGCACARRHRR